MADIELKSTLFSRLEKFRRAASSARVSNPADRLPLKASPAWAQSTDYAVGNVVRAGGYQWVCQTAGTSSASGSGPTLASNPTSGLLQDGTAYWCLLPGRFLTADDALAPTVIPPTTVDPTSGMQGWYPHLRASLCKIYGGYADPATPSYLRVLGQKNSAAGSPFYSGARISLVTNAPLIYFNMVSGTSALRVLVDGQYVSDDAIITGASSKWFGLDFSSVGGSRTRRIEIQGQSRNNGALSLGSIWTARAFQIWAPPADEDIRAAFISDSQFAGNNYANFLPGGSLIARIADQLGWSDPWSFSLGGTGYCYDGGAGAYTYPQRVPDVITNNPDVVVLFGSTNDQDNSFTTTQVKAAALATWQALRAGLPNVPIIIYGIVPNAAASATFEQALKDQFDAWADHNSYFVPISTAAIPWLLGAFNNASFPNMNSFAEDVTSADSTHIKQQALQRWSKMMSDAAREKIAS